MGLRELYETEFAKKAKRIESRSFKKGMEKGIEKGMKKGIEKVIEKGILEAKIEMILRGVANGCSVSILAVITNLSEKEVIDIIEKYSA
jgi:predicted transposase/invertase (TIGR01784 family)